MTLHPVTISNMTDDELIHYEGALPSGRAYAFIARAKEFEAEIDAEAEVRERRITDLEYEVNWAVDYVGQASQRLDTALWCIRKLALPDNKLDQVIKPLEELRGALAMVEKHLIGTHR